MRSRRVLRCKVGILDLGTRLLFQFNHDRWNLTGRSLGEASLFYTRNQDGYIFAEESI